MMLIVEKPLIFQAGFVTFTIIAIIHSIILFQINTRIRITDENPDEMERIISENTALREHVESLEEDDS